MHAVPARVVLTNDDRPRARTSAALCAAVFVAFVVCASLPSMVTLRTPTLGATPSAPIERAAKLEAPLTKLGEARAEPCLAGERFPGTNAAFQR